MRQAVAAAPRVHADPGAALTVSVIDSRLQLESLARDWNRLLSASAVVTVFLTWEWITTWWEVYGQDKRLNVLVARTVDGTLVGVAPLMRTRARVVGPWKVDALQFIGTGGDVTPEHLDFITARGYESSVLDAFLEHLRADATVHLLDLRSLPATSQTRRRFATWRGARPGGWRCLPESVCPVLPLPASPEAFMAQASRNYRKKIGEYQRRLDRELRPRLRMTTTEDDLHRDMNALVALHHKRWQGKSRAFTTDQYVRFHRLVAERLLARGWLRLFTLEAESRPLSVLYCYAHERRYSFYQSGRDPQFAQYRVGLVVMHRAIQQAIAEGATSFDFLRGDEPYKYRWASTEVESVRLVHWKTAPGWVGANLVPRLLHGDARPL